MTYDAEPKQCPRKPADGWSIGAIVTEVREPRVEAEALSFGLALRCRIPTSRQSCSITSSTSCMTNQRHSGGVPSSHSHGFHALENIFSPMSNSIPHPASTCGRRRSWTPPIPLRVIPILCTLVVPRLSRRRMQKRAVGFGRFLAFHGWRWEPTPQASTAGRFLSSHSTNSRPQSNLSG
jgi:hypothetical protein